MAGRRPKPTHLKVVTGNPGKRKLNDQEPKPPREVPSPPEHLTDWGKMAWVKVSLLLDGMGVLTTADSLALERLWPIIFFSTKALPRKQILATTISMKRDGVISILGRRHST